MCCFLFYRRYAEFGAERNAEKISAALGVSSPVSAVKLSQNFNNTILKHCLELKSIDKIRFSDKIRLLQTTSFLPDFMLSNIQNHKI